MDSDMTDRIDTLQAARQDLTHQLISALTARRDRPVPIAPEEANQINDAFYRDGTVRMVALSGMDATLLGIPIHVDAEAPSLLAATR